MLFDTLPKSWKEFLNLNREDYIDLERFVLSEYEQKKVYPKRDNIFNAFKLTDVSNVKAIILGQDPYHGEAQAHGLSFSVQDGIKIPPSLKNIFKELSSDLDIAIPKEGNLSNWSREGVLLLNTVLTVEAGSAASHKKKGWEIFTQEVIKKLNDEFENLIFILWGTPAQKNEKLINQDKHFIIKSPHPSPLSSYRGFFGSQPFSKTNDYLQQKKIKAIDWKL